jgi:hypothetical protein
LVDPEAVGLVRPLDGHAGAARELGGGGGVVEVAVGDEDALERQALVVEHLLHALEVAARVHDRRTAGALAPEDGAVLLERGDGDDGDLHGGGIMPDASPGRARTLPDAQAGDLKGRPGPAW